MSNQYNIINITSHMLWILTINLPSSFKIISPYFKRLLKLLENKKWYQ